MSYRISKLQSVAGKAYVRDMKEVNKVLEFALEGADTGIHFASSGLTWDDMVVCTITDASFCNETIVVNKEKEGNRSQQGYLVVFAPADMMNRAEATIHPISWSSTVSKRVCRSTLKA